jgi:hypothetical protein
MTYEKTNQRIEMFIIFIHLVHPELFLIIWFIELMFCDINIFVDAK